MLRVDVVGGEEIGATGRAWSERLIFEIVVMFGQLLMAEVSLALAGLDVPQALHVWLLLAI